MDQHEFLKLGTLDKSKLIDNQSNSGFTESNILTSKAPIPYYNAIHKDDSEINLEDMQHQESNLWRKTFPKKSATILKNVFMLSWPVTLTNLLEYIIGTVSIGMCGYLSRTELDAASLAITVFIAFGVSIAVGMSTACDTLFAQTYGSKYHHKRMGIHLQRSCIIMVLLSLVVTAVLLNVEPFLIFIGQDPIISRMAANYLVFLCPSLFFITQYNVLARYMQTQQVVYPPVLFGAFSNIFNLVSQYLAIYVMGHDYRASAFCMFVSYFLLWFQAIIYVLVTKFYVPTWDGLTIQALYGWSSFLKLGIPGIAMLFLEVLAWEVLTLLSGILGSLYLATQTILSELQTIVDILGFGIGEGISILVGNALGGGKPMLAKISFHVGVAMTFGYSISTCIIFVAAAPYLPRIFTNDEIVIQECSKLLPYLGVFQILGGLAGATGGAIRGCGRQAPCAVIIAVSYYVISLPVAICLGLMTDLKLMGFWIGLLIGVTVNCVSLILLVCFQDWVMQAQLAQERISYSFKHLSNESLDESSMNSDINADLTLKKLIIIPHLQTCCESATSDAAVEKSENLINSEGLELRKIIISKVLICLAVIVWFLGGLFIKIYLPRDLYWPTNSTFYNRTNSSLLQY